MKKITKAVIPVAGMGTRFLPFTKSVPKEMLPVWDIPSIHFIIDEAMASGSKSVLFITSREKKGVIEDYFDKNNALENAVKKNKTNLLQMKRIPQGSGYIQCASQRPGG